MAKSPIIRSYSVAVLGKKTLYVTDGVTYAVWSYRIEWGGGAKLPADAQLGLVFAAATDIKDPSLYPGIASVQSTQVYKDPAWQRIIVYQTVGNAASPLELAFIGTSDENLSSPVELATTSPPKTDWTLLPFHSDGKPAGQTQVMRGPAALAPVSPVNTTAPRLDNSSRRIAKATLVSLKLDPPPDDAGRALLKSGFVRRLALQPGEVDAAGSALPGTLRSLLKSFEGSPNSGVASPAHAFARVPASALKSFGNAIAAMRRNALVQLTKRSTNDLTPTAPLVADVARARNLINAADTAIGGFEASFGVTPIGMLNLERLEMTPVGIERGALVATIPLAPLEKTAVVHKEWSVTTQEFTSIVTDSLENYSETGVTENTDLAQSTKSQTSHANQFNVNGTVTGSYGPVTATVASSFGSQDTNSASADESRRHAITTTREASARVKQEHKTTIFTSTVTGTSEMSTRILHNPSPTDPIRIDYFSIMRKWHVGLYRYGLRMTYDIAIPEPGAAMRKTYAELADLQSKLGPFVFSEPHATITQTSYLSLAEKYGAQVPPYPATLPDIYLSADPANTSGVGAVTIFDMPPLNVPDGYEISQLFVSFHFESHTGPDGASLSILWSKFSQAAPQGDFGPIELTSSANGAFLLNAGGACVVSVRLENTTNTWIGLRAVVVPTSSAITQWQSAVWNALYGAAQSQYYAAQQQYQNQLAALQDGITGVDTLTLRREENEEVMKGVLRWLLGPSFDFMPQDVRQIFAAQQPPGGDLDLAHGTTFEGGGADGLQLTIAGSSGWYSMFLYEEMVKFINEAIEWESVLYFLYSYFWDVPQAWDFIRQLQHPDSTRQAFLRAGSARVVLTVRKGWEEAWVNFVEAGGFGATLIPEHPYMTVASEIQAYDMTNYPGIPPANPGGGPLPDDGDSVATTCATIVAPSNSPVTIAVTSSEGFLVGYTAIIDGYDSGSTVGGKFVSVQETQTITAVPDKTHITVQAVTNPHGSTGLPFPIMQAGEKGQLIAEWFEYTPSSGTDIAVTSNLATIS